MFLHFGHSIWGQLEGASTSYAFGVWCLVLSLNPALAAARGSTQGVVYSFIYFPDVCVLFFFSHDSDNIYLFNCILVFVSIHVT